MDEIGPGPLAALEAELAPHWPELSAAARADGIRDAMALGQVHLAARLAGQPPDELALRALTGHGNAAFMASALALAAMHSD